MSTFRCAYFIPSLKIKQILIHISDLGVIGVADKRINISSVAIVGIAVGGILVLLLIIDLICCATVNLGIFSMLCRRPKRSPSELDEEKFGR